MKTLKLVTPSDWAVCLLAAVFLWIVIPSVASAKTYNIKMTDEVFNPDSLTVEVGDTVVWTSKSSIAHTLESGDDDGHTCPAGIGYVFSSSGDSYSHTFTEPQSCYFICRLHGAGMNGVVHVKPKSDMTSTTIQGK